jgi:TRAP-type C4-dicarboxylate transport system permease small subunit
MNIIKKIYANFEEYACATLISIMILSLMVQILVRAVLGTSIAFTEELSRYSFIWTIYLGGALVAKHTSHVRITAQFMLFPKKVRLFFLIIADTIWVIFNFFLIAASLGALDVALEFPEISPTLFIVKAYVEAVIPFSFLLMSYRIIEKYILKIKANDLYSLVNYEEAT